MNAAQRSPRRAAVLKRDQARLYDMGRMRSVFLADGEQTDLRYSISEWWLEPRTRGPGTHFHPEDHIYYVLAGTVSVQLDGEWTEAPRGSCVLIPGDTPHDFENRSTAECGFLSINFPGGFEEELPGIVKWFEERPLGDVAEE